MRTQLKVLWSATILAAIVAIPLHAQTFGEVTGHIRDASGAAVPAARITLTNVATNALRNVVATESGDYTFPSVPPGFYNIRVEQPSFKTTSTSNVQVQVQQTLRLDFTLEVGQVTESIEVSASAQMLQAENVSLGTVIENKGVTETRPGLPATAAHQNFGVVTSTANSMRQVQLGLRYSF